MFEHSTFQIASVATENGSILPEYRASYNRTLEVSDIETMMSLISTGQFQTFVDTYNVRKFVTESGTSCAQLLTLAVKTGNLDITKFISKRLSYDDRAKGLWDIDTAVNNQKLRSYIRKQISKYGNDYESEFDRVFDKDLF